MALTFPAFVNAQLRHPSWLAASDAALATWVKLACRCAEEENGGRIYGGRTWTERMWIGAANVSQDGVAEAVAASLVSWDGDDLVVRGYDQVAETKARILRDNGRFGHMGAEHGKKGGRPRKEKTGSRNPRGGSEKTPPLLSDPILSVPIPTSPDQSAPASRPAEQTAPPPPIVPPPIQVVRASRIYLAAKTDAFLSVAEAYPNQHRLNEAAQVWQELVATRGGGSNVEVELSREILGAFRNGFLRRHPYDGEVRFVPKLETFLANQSWQERAPRAPRPSGDDDLPERGSH